MKIVLVLSLFAMLFSSCTTIQAIKDMNEDDFALFAREVELMTKIGVKKVCETHVGSDLKLLAAFNILKPFTDQLTTEGMVQLSEFAAGLLDNVVDEDIKLALELVMIRLQRYEAIKFVNGTKILTEKSAKIIQSLVKGAIEGATISN